ncbi:MAG: hypothetical protein ACRBHB_05590 [Arenicella sp.]
MVEAKQHQQRRIKKIMTDIQKTTLSPMIESEPEPIEKTSNQKQTTPIKQTKNLADSHVALNNIVLTQMTLYQQIQGMRQGAQNYIQNTVESLLSPVETAEKMVNGLIQYHRFARVDDTLFGNLIYSPTKTIPLWASMVQEQLSKLTHNNPEIRGEAWAETANPLGKITAMGTKLAGSTIAMGMVSGKKPSSNVETSSGDINSKPNRMPNSQVVTTEFGDIHLYFVHPRLKQLEHIIQYAAEIANIKDWTRYIDSLAITDSPQIDGMLFPDINQKSVLAVHEASFKSENVEELFALILHELNHQRQYKAMPALAEKYSESEEIRSLIEILVEARTHGIMRRNSIRKTGKELPETLSTMSIDYIQTYLHSLQKMIKQNPDSAAAIEPLIAKAHRYIRLHFSPDDAKRIIN